MELRESERRQAAENAWAWFRFGERERALASVERAQASPRLSPRFAADSTLLKARILEELGRREQSLAHYRYLRDRHPDALRGEEVPAEALRPLPDPPDPAPETRMAALDVPEPRYPRQASWADVGGEVHVRFRVGERGRAEAIHVLGPAHPLLASLAVEAVAGARVRERDVERPDAHSRDVRFHFEARPVPAETATASARQGES